MNRFDRKMRKIAAEEQIEVPESIKLKMENILIGLPEQNGEKRKGVFFPRLAMGIVCVLVLTLFVLPNVSTVYAQAMEQIPVVGKIVQVITIRNYFYSDEYHEMDIDVPKVELEEEQDAVQEINEDVENLTKKLMNQFYDEVEFVGNEGHGSIYVDYETITNTKDWFTLKLSVHEVAGSGNSYFKFYHIDRKTEKIVKLGDLFLNNSYEKILKEEIKSQMKLQMEEDKSKVFWIEDSVIGDCLEVDESHNFYFNREGELVIPFDKYEVAPGAMGCPEFVIDKSVYKDLLKKEYKDLAF